MKFLGAREHFMSKAMNKVGIQNENKKKQGYHLLVHLRCLVFIVSSSEDSSVDIGQKLSLSWMTRKTVVFHLRPSFMRCR